MLISAPRVAPRWKEWIPLFTQQLRLRNLIQILILKIRTNSGDSGKKRGKPSYYYTLHLTPMSAPFFTSDKIENEHSKWKEIEAKDFDQSVCGAESAIILRLWSCETCDQAIAIWGINFSGLVYLGSTLNVEISKLKPNVLVLRFPGGYFTDPSCFEHVPKSRLVNLNVSMTDVRQSYTVSLLCRLHSLQQVIMKQSKAAESLKDKISRGGYVELDSGRGTLLKKLMSKAKPKVERQELITMKKKLEVAKFRIVCLKENKNKQIAIIDNLKKKLEKLSDDNQEKESNIMNNYRLLSKEVDVYKEWKQGHIEKRELQLHSRAMWNFRSNQLVSELGLIYPISEKLTKKCYICGVHLPNSEDFTGVDEIQLSVALGYVVHVIQTASIFLQVPLRYPVVHLGSRSVIIDQITKGLVEREFPLYQQSKDKILFDYAVYLLNKNIAQLRWYYGYPTSDLRTTLSNLVVLIQPKTSPQLSSRKSFMSSNLQMFEGTSPTFSTISSTTHVEFPREFNFSCSQSPERRSPSFRAYLAKHKELEKSHLNNSLSYSLDKGLNEYEEIKKCVKPDDVKIPTTGLRNHVGSDPNLVPNLDSTQNSSLKSETKEIFVIELDSSKPGTSDEENTPLLKIMNEIVPQTDSTKLDVFQTNAAVEKVATEAILQNETEVRNLDKDKIQTEKTELDPGTNTDNNNKDNLLANVTSRTQALADQPTTFNRFRTRSRFSSTVDSNN